MPYHDNCIWTLHPEPGTNARIARNHQGTLTSKPLSAAERVATLMHNAAPVGTPGTDANSGSPQKKRKNCHNSVSGQDDIPQKTPAPNSVQTAPPIVAVGSDSIGVSDNIMAGTNLISQALNFLMTANIKTIHEDRNLETARSQVREAEQKVEALSAEVGELKRRVTDLEAEKTVSVNISYIVAVVDVMKRLKEEAPNVDLGFLRDDLKAYVASYPPPRGVVLDFGVLGTMDEFLGA